VDTGLTCQSKKKSTYLFFLRKHCTTVGRRRTPARKEPPPLIPEPHWTPSACSAQKLTRCRPPWPPTPQSLPRSAWSERAAHSPEHASPPPPPAGSPTPHRTLCHPRLALPCLIGDFHATLRPPDPCLAEPARNSLH
jgi:hypothetical protein